MAQILVAVPGIVAIILLTIAISVTSWREEVTGKMRKQFGLLFVRVGECNGEDLDGIPQRLNDIFCNLFAEGVYEPGYINWPTYKYIICEDGKLAFCSERRKAKSELLKHERMEKKLELIQKAEAEAREQGKRVEKIELPEENPRLIPDGGLAFCSKLEEQCSNLWQRTVYSNWAALALYLGAILTAAFAVLFASAGWSLNKVTVMSSINIVLVLGGLLMTIQGARFDLTEVRGGLAVDDEEDEGEEKKFKFKMPKMGKDQRRTPYAGDSVYSLCFFLALASFLSFFVMLVASCVISERDNGDDLDRTRAQIAEIKRARHPHARGADWKPDYGTDSGYGFAQQSGSPAAAHGVADFRY